MSLGRCLYVFCLFSILERTADVREKLWPVKRRGCRALTGRRRGARSKKPGSRSEMRDAGVHSGGCSTLPCSPWVRLCRERSEEEISGKRHCGGGCFAGWCVGSPAGQGWTEVWLAGSGSAWGHIPWERQTSERSPKKSLVSKCLFLRQVGILFRGLLRSELCSSAVCWGNRQPSCRPAPGSCWVLWHSVLSSAVLWLTSSSIQPASNHVYRISLNV